jgi:methionine aminopeptidase
MITLIVGKKGSGKTKKLIENANQAIEKSNGNVVVIEKGLKLTYDISHQARLIDTDAYGIQGTDALCGFISGICAGNYDVTDIFVDSTLKIIGQDMKAFTSFAEKMNALSTLADTKITLLVSVDANDLPEEINSVAVQI